MSSSDREARKRRGIERTAKQLREQVQRDGGSISQTQAETRVRQARTNCERKRGE